MVHEFGAGGGTRLQIDTAHLKLTAYPAQDNTRRGNRITLVLELELPPKMHVYTPGVEGYRPVSVAVSEASYLKVHDTVFPNRKSCTYPRFKRAYLSFKGRSESFRI